MPSGTVVQTLDYFPYGATRISSGQNAENRQYIGQFSDQSGLLYLQARYQDPQRGQFLSEDPTFLAIGNPQQLKQFSQQDQQTFLSDPQQINSYSYGRDNPVTKKDPSGLSIWEPIYLGGEYIEQTQYAWNSVKYVNMTPQQRAEEASRMNFESLTALPGLVVFGSTIGTQLMLANFALQGLDYGCSKIGCPPMNLAANGMTPLQIQQQMVSSPGARLVLSGQVSNTPSFGTFNNLFSSSVQTRQDAAKNINFSTGNFSSGSGGSAPSNNSLWVTPSGAVVTFGGQLVAPPPKH